MAAGVVFTPRASAASPCRDDLSVIGFDDTPIAAHIWPPLTTVRWPIVSMARAAARKLVGDIVGGEADEAAVAVPLDAGQARLGGAAAGRRLTSP